MASSSIIKYLDNNKIKGEGPIHKGTFHGKIKSYHLNGMIASQCPVKYGKPHGTWRTYDENGKLLLELDFQNGILLKSIKAYNDNGESDIYIVNLSLRRKISGYINNSLEFSYNEGNLEYFLDEWRIANLVLDANRDTKSKME